MTDRIKSWLSQTLFFLLFFFFSSFLFPQSPGQILRSSQSVNEKINKLFLLKDHYIQSDLDSAIYILTICDSLASTTKDPDLKCSIKQDLTHMLAAQPDKALKLAYEILDISKTSGNCRLVSKAYLVLARVNWFIRNDEKVFGFWNESLKEAEKCKDKETLLLVYTNGEEFHYNTGRYDKCRAIWNKMAQIDPELRKEARFYSNVGDVFRAENKLDSADAYYRKAMQISERLNDSSATIQLYLNYSLIPRKLEKYDTAIKYCKKALALATQLNLPRLINNSHRQLSDTYYDQGDYQNAKFHQEKILHYAQSMNITIDQMWANHKLANILAHLNNYMAAYYRLNTAFDMFQDYHNSEGQSNLNKVEEQYLEKQKQLEIQLLQQQTEAERKIKNISIMALTVSLVLTAFVILAMIKIYRSKKIISQQHQETENQKKIIEEKQKDILDSIRYARRIQQSLMPKEKYLEKIIRRSN